ncbi:inactive protein kinase SELMODRAFT_444075-like [Cucurbita moschata]|uniref:Inactive protein kinase SELMODRAFT_444075-like n=1 Tax=Cucurbita moschata TaxID=3662 RepID=A0A6J1GC47_CUCMO|nr:inactive protein kinase SELMODRAFT_444075-like [Cucurbita moschata]XP_022949477.1 inactive protein kinase SELMODRAFT_444075-like [Cucurbita moschata]
MSREQKRGKQDKGSDDVQKVIVAVKASKEIPKTALVWALTHVVHIGDCITLLVVVPSQTSGRKFWGFPRFSGDCASGQKKAHSGTTSELKYDISDTCSQMILQLHDVYDPNKINVKIKIVSGSPSGAVTAEAKRVHASWVVLDKQLKHEEKCCMEELQCNIVVMKRSQPKVLRLNLVGSQKKEPQVLSPLPFDIDEGSESHHKEHNDPLDFIRGPVVTPSSSPELGTPFTATEAGTSSVSSSDPGTSPFFNSEMNGDTKKEELFVIKENKEVDAASSDLDIENLSVSSGSLRFQPWMTEFLSSSHLQSSQHITGRSQRFDDLNQMSTRKAFQPKFTKLDREARIEMSSHRSDNDFHGDVRDAVSLSRNSPPGPPPLCSICQHKAPVFGKPPRWYSYAELELATGGFSQANFLAEGGYGSVHRGVLPDGQVVAVKQHKLASSQGDHEFCSEVEVLSCAQHRNVVMLIGFCIEEKKRLLVYEYICNGSLDSHLYGRQQEPLGWTARQKIAVGAARGLRYLHEECRVGCIVHRDMRPNNILITHDFEPLVGDFGLARWQPDGDTGVETRVIGTFGYLAPEYAQSGQITEKADVYSFGVVLVELITGRKAVDLGRPKGQQCLTEWARPLLDELVIDELIDPRLGNSFTEHEVYCMVHAASLCIRRDPNARPRMSQVLRILEGDLVVDANYLSTPGYDVGNRSGRMWTEQQQQNYSGSFSEEPIERLNEKVCVESLRPSYWERDSRTGRTSSGSDL